MSHSANIAKMPYSTC